MPVIVTPIGVGVVSVFSGAPVTSLKLKASGVVSAAFEQNGSAYVPLPLKTPLVHVRDCPMDAQLACELAEKNVCV